MEIYDAIDVGGGPAGSTCARHLRRAGLSVLIIDRARFPRDKVCAGWITPEVIHLTDLDVAEYRQGRVFQPIRAFRVGLMHEALAETRYDNPISFGIRRFEFDHYLLQRSGAKLRCGVSVSTLRRLNDQWIINDAIAAPIIVGSGGHFCPVARMLNPRRSRRPVVAAVELEAELTDAQLAELAVTGDTPLLEFSSDFDGYAWCFRKGRFVNVGLGRLDSHDVAREARAYVAQLIARGLMPASLATRLKGHAYLLAGSSPRACSSDGVILAGDAAGLAECHSGEGIRPAIESGIMAAQTILAAGHRYDRASLRSYETRLQSRFAPGSVSDMFSHAIPTSIARRVGRRLMRSKGFVRHVVLDRWFLGRHRPMLPEPIHGVLYESC